jgi:branched-subunit amino acid aminotransferase/4-amino-4-deoxychorismate lyase
MPSEPLVFWNGEFLPRSRAGLPWHDAGFVFGATATDLVRTFRHRLFRLDEHVRRFRQSCDLALIPLRHSDTELAQIATELADRNAVTLEAGGDLALVMFATPGPVGYYLGELGGAGDGEPTLAMHTFALPFARYRRMFREGAKLRVPSVRHVPAVSVDRRIKQRSRLFWWLAEREVHAVDPTASALLLDESGCVTETAAANFLIVVRGIVVSPPRRHILSGVTLAVVEELCAELGIPFEERPLSLDECKHADEAMLTSTPYGIAGVAAIDDANLPWPGPTWRKLLDAFSRHASLDIAAQIGCE